MKIHSKGLLADISNAQEAQINTKESRKNNKDKVDQGKNNDSANALVETVNSNLTAWLKTKQNLALS